MSKGRLPLVARQEVCSPLETLNTARNDDYTGVYKWNQTKVIYHLLTWMNWQLHQVPEERRAAKE